MEDRQNVWYKKLSEPETDNLGKGLSRQKDKVEKLTFKVSKTKNCIYQNAILMNWCGWRTTCL